MRVTPSATTPDSENDPAYRHLDNTTMNYLTATAAALAIASLSVGCATVRDTYAPNGRKAYSLNCSGVARGWDKCYSAAGDICKAAGYDVITMNGEPFAVASANRQGGFGAMSSERAMVVACKG